MADSIRLYENLRVVSYAPVYVALARDLFAKQGISVEAITSPNTSETAEGVVAGRVDVAWGGPMRVMLHHDRDPDCDLVCFCKIVGPEPFCLIGNEPNADFRFSDLMGKRVGVVSEVPTPWLTLQEDLRRAGLAPADLEQTTPRTMAENVDALNSAKLDVIQVMEPYTELALSKAGGHLWHPMASRGDVAFTSFYTTARFREAEAEKCRALTNAIDESLAWIRANDDGAVAQVLTDFFPDIDAQVLDGAVRRYRGIGIWPADTFIGASEFVRLKGALLSAGFISRDVAYDRAVYNTGN
jgi:NitT/TauT family transport system substrate-binding protein